MPALWAYAVHHGVLCPLVGELEVHPVASEARCAQSVPALWAAIGCARIRIGSGLEPLDWEKRLKEMPTRLQEVRDIALDFPAKLQKPVDDPLIVDRLAGALGIRPVYVGRNDLDYLVEAATEAEVRGLTPDMALLKTLPIRGTIVTARSSASCSRSTTSNARGSAMASITRSCC